MKIIKTGRINTIICSCNCVFEYEPSDINSVNEEDDFDDYEDYLDYLSQGGFEQWVECPICNKQHEI